MDKTIALKDVRTALMCGIVRRTLGRDGGRPMARMAAFTLNPAGYGPDCRHPMRDQLAHGSCVAVMTSGHLFRVVMATHLRQGPVQVRRTWGKSTRAMQVELRDGLLR